MCASQAVRQASLKWSLMNQQEPSALEHHMLNLFWEEEAKDGLNATQKVRLSFKKNACPPA